MKDYYKTLGIPNGSSQEEIKKTYRNLAKKWHPDVNKSLEAENKFKEINEAYEYLTRPNNDIFNPFEFSKQDLWGNFFGRSQSYRTVRNSELRISFNGQITDEDIAEILKMLVDRGCKVVGQSVTLVS